MALMGNLKFCDVLFLDLIWVEYCDVKHYLSKIDLEEWYMNQNYNQSFMFY